MLKPTKDQKPKVFQKEFDDLLADHHRWLKDPATGDQLVLLGKHLVGAKLRDLNLKSIDLEECDLLAAQFQGSNMEAVDLQRARLLNAQFERTYLARANFYKAGMQAAEFFNCDLTSSDMTDTELKETRFIDCDLKDVDFEGAICESTRFSGSDLRGANFKGVDLSSCGFYGTIGNRKQIKNIHVCGEYPIAYTKTQLQIGCENHSITDWWDFNDPQIKGLGVGALDFWLANKDYIRMTIERYPAED